jgi:RNA polymerase sigma-70 factor, ECF subfamily
MRAHNYRQGIQTFLPAAASYFSNNGKTDGMIHGQLKSFESHATDEPTATIAAAVNGDVAAFERLYRQYSTRIYGLCLRLTGQREAAEDCTQEAFVAAWRAIGGFERRSLFSSWLHRIAVHTVLSRRRGLRNQFEVPEPESGLPDRADPSSGGPPLDVEKAIAALPDGARHVLVLVGIYGHSHADAAASLGIAEGTCKAQLHRARQLLAASLQLEES